MTNMVQASSGRSPSDYDKLVDGWIKYHEEGLRRGGQVTDDEEGFWTFKMMRELCRIDPETAWDVMQRIVEKVEDPAVLGCLGAGPLEDLLVQHGKDFIDRVVAEIQRNARFAEVASSVWQNLIPTEVWIRLQKALDERGT